MLQRQPDGDDQGGGSPDGFEFNDRTLLVIDEAGMPDTHAVEIGLDEIVWIVVVAAKTVRRKV